MSLSVNEISSLLRSRLACPQETSPPHRDWDSATRAALVILWGMLVYPQLDPDLRKKKGSYFIHVDQLVYLFEEYLGDRRECMKILSLLKQHDYIRLQAGERIIPGTGLLAAVDAAKMYKCFRSSVLSRKIFQLKQREG